MTGPKMALVEVFLSPQGEGFNVGRQAVFVRFAGCPLACEFSPGVVCDTPYQKAGHKVTVSQLFAELIFPLLPFPCTRDDLRRMSIQEVPMLILTGGEPTAAPLFDPVALAAKHAGFYVAVETNGTRWRYGLVDCDWISVSPKDTVPQTSTAQWHNRNPGSPALDSMVVQHLRDRMVEHHRGGEYRYVITADSPVPPYHLAHRHYLSPAIASDGSGEEWRTGFPGFAPGALERCREIAHADPRWRISIQVHKVMGVR